MSRAAWFLCGVGLVLSLSAAQGTSYFTRIEADTVVARRLAIQDENGKVRITLNVNAEMASIGLSDENGVPAFAILRKGEVTQVTFFNKEKYAMTILADNGSPAIKLFDSNGKTRAGMSMAEVDGKESPFIIFMDDKGQPVYIQN